ncbi:OmcA/MtrC family decaheme c-type cytochrome [Shewanella mesophila]|uniref:OmcA/MtrC family decaheme c-type cytochrome n=1 Tax=Shewanella mesophila TaxID=2864208 RepID=UPI001C6615CA|nr:OmcA/MtrC family decaheme c-type cytochrome [Shewanella mesophila]QYJ87387.1 OmcA/MtrC family decaheme c-type cytochrome [Shewanella mesophila]
MMNIRNNKFALLLAASAVSMALSGCGGSDGNDGNPGNPGGSAADHIDTLNLDITKVSYDNGVPTINVFATNEEDLPVVGLTKLEVKKAVQLLPQGSTGAGDSAQWQFIGSQKAFTDHKNGNYSLTVEVEGYNPELTQRFNVIASAATLQDGVTTVPRTEISQDFSGEGYAPLYTKNIVATASCNTCHGEGQEIYHGYNVETCISCHTQELADSRGKPQVAFSHLVHNVHNDAKMYGPNMELSAETAHAIVQDNCQACHVQSDDLAEWGNWSRVPTMETCTSCHVNIDFQAGKGHSQQSDNSNCVACHNASWTEEIHSENAIQKKALIDQYGIQTESTIDSTTKAATISIQIVNTAGENVDINDVLPMIQRVEIVTNVGPNNVTLGYGGKDSINAIKNGVVDAKATIQDGKLVYTTTKELMLNTEAGADNETAFTFVGWAMCSEAGKFVKCEDPAFDGGDADKYTAMKADLAFASLSGQTPSMRHVDSVNFTACASCHTPEFEIHKGSHHAGFVMSEQLSHAKDANDMPIIGVDACVACHTPDGTYAGGTNKGALEMKLHVVHGEQGIIKDCAQCHNDFNLDAFKVKGALATKVINPYTPSQESLYTTPITATCTSCHTSDSVKAHAESQGAIINGAKDVANDAAQLETCFYCHAPVIEDHTAVKM